MSQRALALADALGGQLASLGPGVCSLSVSELATWHMVRVGAASSDVLFRIADDLGLDRGGPAGGVGCCPGRTARSS